MSAFAETGGRFRPMGRFPVARFAVTHFAVTLAEREGFEPSRGLRPNTLSRRAP